MTTRTDYLRDQRDMRHAIGHLSSIPARYADPIDLSIFTPFFGDDLNAIQEASTRIVNSGVPVSAISIPPGLIVRLIELLNKEPQLCQAALTMLTFISAGLTFNISEFIAGNFVECAINLFLSSKDALTMSSVIIIIGNLIGDGTLLIGTLLETGFVNVLGEFVEENRTKYNILPDICWCICNLTRHIRDKDFPYTTDQLHTIAGAITRFLPLVESHEQASYYLGWALTYSLDSAQCANYYDTTHAFFYALKFCKIQKKVVGSTVAFFKSIEAFLKQNLPADKLYLLIRGPLYQQLLRNTNASIPATIHSTLLDIWILILKLKIDDKALAEQAGLLDGEAVSGILSSSRISDPLSYMHTPFTRDTACETLMSIFPSLLQISTSNNISTLRRIVELLSEFLVRASVEACQQVIGSSAFICFLEKSLHPSFTEQPDYTRKLLELILGALEVPGISVEAFRNDLSEANLITAIASLDQDAATSLLVGDILHYLGDSEGAFPE